MIKWTIPGVNQTPEGLVASAAVLEDTEAPTIPPVAWFTHNPVKPHAYPIQFEADGRVHGYASEWGLTHIGHLNKDVYTPRSETNYSKFCTGSTLLDDASTIRTGRLTINTVHPKMRGAAWNEVQAYYDYSGAAVADVTVFEDEVGVYIAGAVRPTVSQKQLRIARGSDWSPDWRSFDGNLEMVALLAVNLSGFIVDGLVASGVVTEETTAQDFCMPGDLYCEFSTQGEVDLLIGNHFKSEETPVDASLEERLSLIEEYIAQDKARREAFEILDGLKNLV